MFPTGVLMNANHHRIGRNGRNARLSICAAALLGFGANASAQTKWDLPAGSAASNFHIENLVPFTADVDKATAGKLKITVHANASLFKAPEIKRAVRGGQAQMGEILMANFQNEWQSSVSMACPFWPTATRPRPSSTRRRGPRSTRSWASRE